MKKFGIDAETTDEGLAAVSDWFDRYAGLLLHFQPGDAASLHAFTDYAPQWTGEHIGTNVVWDLGTYIGECVIARRPRAHWDLNTGDPDLVSLEAIGFQRPCVSGPGWRRYCDPITWVFLQSDSKSQRMRLGYARGVSLGGNLAGYVANRSRGAPPNPTLTRDGNTASTTSTPRRVARRRRQRR